MYPILDIHIPGKQEIISIIYTPFFHTTPSVFLSRVDYTYHLLTFFVGMYINDTYKLLMSNVA